MSLTVRNAPWQNNSNTKLSPNIPEVSIREEDVDTGPIEVDGEFSRSDDITLPMEENTTLNEAFGGAAGEGSYFSIIDEGTTHVRRFGIAGHKTVFKILPIPEGIDAEDWLRSAITAITLYITAKADSASDFIGMQFDFSPEFPSGWISFRTVDNLSPDMIWECIHSICQSNDSLILSDTPLTVTSTVVKLPSGRGRVSRPIINDFESSSLMKRGIITIKNDRDFLCLPRALVVAIAHLKKKEKSYLKKISNAHGLFQKHKALKLLAKAHIEIPPEGAGILQLRQFLDYLKKYNIRVYKWGSRGRDVMFKGDNPGARFTINLLHSEGHYNVIKSLTAAFDCKYFCEECNVPYYVRIAHARCCKKTSCSGCFSPGFCQPNNPRRCNECHRYFYNDECFSRHLISFSRSKSLCEKLRICKFCNRRVKPLRNSSHTCGEICCKICKTFGDENHLCYIQKVGGRKQENDLFIFFDIESRQEEKTPSGTIHEPNLLIVQHVCSVCSETSDAVETMCSACGIRLHIFRGDSCVRQFLEYVFLPRRSFKKIICIAHNGQAYDHQFILKSIIEDFKQTPQLLMRGTKIIKLSIAGTGIIFIDSLNYFSMSLAKLPKAFGLSLELKKGFFPHGFNRKENYNYKGPIPDRSFYFPESMTEEGRKEFDTWHMTQMSNGVEFVFQKELESYCLEDVNILRSACLKFRKYFLDECGVCPFSESVTLASACNLVFRRNYLKPKTIGIVPKNGYRLTDRHSAVSLDWLAWEEHERKIKIDTCERGRETILPQTRFKVDGFHAESRTVFEFLGCFFHGHPQCFSTGRDRKLFKDSEETLNSMYYNTLTRLRCIKDLGYNVVSVWECEFNKIASTDLRCISFLEERFFHHPKPIMPRDALYGGRTGNTKLHYEVKNGETIKYVDVCSLYPYVCKYGKFPTGHPNVFVGEECKNLTGPNYDLTPVEGIIKCRILPPDSLYHPVLPLKLHGKLMFVLCFKCALQQNEDVCHHSDSDRSIVGTWVVDEVKRAVLKGYKILFVYEIWQYETVQANRCTGVQGLFTSYIDKFLKMKQEASGFPEECISNEQKASFVDEYFNKEGVRLDLAEVKKNPGKRSLGKAMLNTFWGKFAQRDDLSQTTIVDQPEQLYDLLLNPSCAVNFIQEVNEDVIFVNWNCIEGTGEPLPFTSPVIAAYTTCQARLRLYDFLDRLGDKVLYYDTDSVIYIAQSSAHELPLGSFLGDLTNELEQYGPQAYITDFVSGGPKSYGYTVLNPQTGQGTKVIKIKGLSLNNQIEEEEGGGGILNFNTLKDMVVNSGPSRNVISNRIKRTDTLNVVSVKENKRYSVKFMKRRRLPDGDSLPYGYKDV